MPAMIGARAVWNLRVTRVREMGLALHDVFVNFGAKRVADLNDATRELDDGPAGSDSDIGKAS